MRIKKEWTSAELDDLVKNFAMTRNKILAARCCTSVRSMVRKARELGLEKDPSFRETIDFAGFKTGTKPWNKGKKTSSLRPPTEKQKEAYFKPGREAPTKNPEIIKKSIDTRTKTIKRDKLRRRYGMTPITKLKLKNLD